MGFVGATYRDLPQGARAEDFNYLLKILHGTGNGEQRIPRFVNLIIFQNLGFFLQHV